MNELVMMKYNEATTTSLIVAKELNRTHQSIIKTIRQYNNEFKKFGLLRIEIHQQKNQNIGRPLTIYHLNEEQLMFLIMNMRIKNDENDKVLEFKIKITKEFFKMRRTLLQLSTQQTNEIWLEQRKELKQIRKQTTDTIKKFVRYAKEQGSQNADRYYANITKMQNKALFFIEHKYKNIRDICNLKQLDELKQADEIIEKALEDGMDKEMFYKDIFKLAKKRVEIFSELKGKSIIPFFERIGVNENEKM